MNNQQAINLLKNLEQSLDDYCELNDEGKTAFRMAIMALELFGNSEQLPPAQPERKRGRWNITDAYPHNVYCSECYTRFAQTHWAVWEDGSLPRNFCPNCGADMREVDDERPD